MRRTGTKAPEWSSAEVDPLVRAARRAPVYGGGNPWVLEPGGHHLSLYELPHHSFRDRLGVGRLLTCGAVLHNVHVALRAAGWRVEVTLPRDVTRPDLIAVLTAGQRLAATPWEVLDHRATEEPGTPGQAELSVLLSANQWPRTRVRPVDVTDEPAVATLPAGTDAVLVSTDGDSRQDILLAGAALQAVRLRACALGTRTTAVPGPLHGQPGHNWALLGVGPHSEE